MLTGGKGVGFCKSFQTPEMHTSCYVSLEYSWVYTDAQMCIYVLVHFRQDLLQGQKDMESALEHLLENLSPPSVEALPVALMLLPHVNQLDKVLCTNLCVHTN